MLTRGRGPEPEPAALPSWSSGADMGVSGHLLAFWEKRSSIMPELEKEMATHSSVLAWRIPWTEEPGGLQSMGSQRDGHN